MSAVICTRNRGSRVLPAVRSVLADGSPDLAVVVVDQSDDFRTQEACSSCRIDPRFSYLRSGSRGLGAARNAGVVAAPGELIAFTDDDCEVAIGWVEEAHRAFSSDPRVGVVFGNVHPAPHKGEGFIPSYRARKQFVARHVWHKSRVEGIGACMAVRRETWCELRGFDEAVGAGSAFESGQDTDFALRALLAGWRVVETPAMSVVHSGLRTWEESAAVISGYMRGLAAVYVKQVKCLRVSVIPVLIGLALRWLFGSPVVNLGRCPSRRLRLVAFLRGAWLALRTPVDRSTGHFRLPGGEASSAPVAAPLPRVPAWSSIRQSGRLRREYCLLLHRLGLLRPLSYVEWIITRACDLRCGHCGVSAGPPGPGELNTDEAKAVIEQLGEAGVRSLALAGGEPLLRADLPELINWADRHGIKPGLITNGLHVAERWSELKRFSYFLYLTSLDGDRQHHDASRGREGLFDRALDGLSKFASIGTPERIVNTVVHPGNVAQLESLFSILAKSGATRWQLTPVVPEGRAAGHSELQLSSEGLRYLVDLTYRSQPGLTVELGESRAYLRCLDPRSRGQSFFCGAGLTHATIMPNGDVAGCFSAYDTGIREGNVRLEPFATIWQKRFQFFRNTRHAPECSGCAYLDRCLGGCKAEMAREHRCLKEVWEGGPANQDTRLSR